MGTTYHLRITRRPNRLAFVQDFMMQYVAIRAERTHARSSSERSVEITLR